jgi:hypothetical protein
LNAVIERLEQQKQATEPVSNPIKKRDAPTKIIPFLTKLIQSDPKASPFVYSQSFSDPVEKFFGREGVSRAKVAEFYTDTWSGVASRPSKAEPEVARIYVVENDSRYFVRLPYQFYYRVGYKEYTGRNLLLAEVTVKNGEPEGIVTIDIEPIEFISPFIAKSPSFEQEGKEEQAEFNDSVADEKRKAATLIPSTLEVSNDHASVLTPALVSPGLPSVAGQAPADIPGSSAFIMSLNQALNNHDWDTVTRFTVNKLTNYFGHTHVTNDYIRRDMQNDVINYRSVQSSVFPETFTQGTL